MDINLIGIKIMTLRKERSYTQESLAELLSISPQAVSKWENGHSLPDTTLLPDLAKALDTSIDAILTESRIQILSAYYGDGIESHNVTNRLNRLIQNDSLEIMVSAAALACPSISGRPSYLIVKYQADHDVYYGVAENNKQLTINMTRKGFENNESLEIIAAAYGSAEKYYNVLHKIEHYRLFQWNEYHANHETFPSDPINDETRREYVNIETERLILRELTTDDLEELHTILSDAESMQHYPKPFDLIKSKNWIEWNIENYTKYGFGLWAVILKENNQLIGDCGITMQNINGRLEPEIGYHINKKYVNKGYATEAAKECMKYAFEIPKFDKKKWNEFYYGVRR